MSVPALGYCPDRICSCNGNDCGGRGCAGTPSVDREPNRRRLFKCVGCRRWVPWSFGSDDNLPNHCDDCWNENALTGKDASK